MITEQLNELIEDLIRSDTEAKAAGFVLKQVDDAITRWIRDFLRISPEKVELLKGAQAVLMVLVLLRDAADTALESAPSEMDKQVIKDLIVAETAPPLNGGEEI